MADYEKMYLKMLQATEQAVRILIAAQLECEELFVSSPEPELKVVKLPTPKDDKKRTDEK